jgi:hypothetical protein
MIPDAPATAMPIVMTLARRFSKPCASGGESLTSLSCNDPTCPAMRSEPPPEGLKHSAHCVRKMLVIDRLWQYLSPRNLFVYLVEGGSVRTTGDEYHFRPIGLS